MDLLYAAPETAIVLASALLAVALFLIFLGVRAMRTPDVVEERFHALVDAHQDVITARELELRTPFHQRVLAPAFSTLLGTLGRLSIVGSTADIQRKLVMARNPGNLTAVDFQGLRVLLATLLGVGGVFVGYTMRAPASIMDVIPFAGGGALIGLMYPIMWLNRHVKARQREIRRALPDALDMLTIAVDAGLGFDSAVLKVVEKWSNALTEEFRLMLHEMRMGVSRAEALRNLSRRTGVEELGSFVAILVQADRLGASITDVLHAQSDSLRLRRRQWAEEQARKAPVKMLIPLILFVFPATFVVILGPAVPRIMEAFGK